MAPKMHSNTTNDQETHHLLQSGRNDEALALAKKLVKDTPGNPENWYLLAASHAALNQLPEVIRCCEKTISLNPGHAAAIYNLAAALQQTGQTEKALSMYLRCTELNPRHTNSLLAAGSIYLSMGDLHSASHCYSSAIQINTNLPDAFYKLALIKQKLNDFPAAVENYLVTLKLMPHHIEATNNLGHIYNETGQLQKAEQQFKQLIQLTPESPEAYCNIAAVFETTGKIDDAEQNYRRAIDLSSNFLPALTYLGFLLADEGRTPEAIYYFDKVLSASPTEDTAIAGKAAALEKLGKTTDAKIIIDSAINNGSRNPDVILTYCKIYLRLKEPESALNAALSVLEDETLPTKGQVDINRIIGDLYNSMNDSENAFKYYQKANQLSPYTYDHLKHVQYIDNIIHATKNIQLTKERRTQHGNKKLIFIIGMPRSGTSLVEQILSSHPDIYGAGELIAMGDIARLCNYPQAFTLLTDPEIKKYNTKYTSLVTDLAGDVDTVSDKMPHNFLYIGLIVKLFPNARFIHIQRNALDNCLSLYFQGFNPSHSYSTRLDQLGKYYLEYTRLMAHWTSKFTDSILTVQYEDIVENTEQQTRKLLAFCEMPWSESCLTFYKSNRFVKTPSYDQVRQPIYRSSIGRWKNYSDYISPLRNTLKFNQKTGK